MPDKRVTLAKRKFDPYVKNVFAAANGYVGAEVKSVPLPTFDESRGALPQPFWDRHDNAIACYWKVWEIAFRNLRQPTVENGFVVDYIDTAFNNHLFLWDSCFILMFGKYGRRVFDFQGTLNNLYCKQHPDGFICRELSEADGGDLFERHDPTTTGPNIFAWAEWEYFLTSGDGSRLESVFWPILAYHQWMRANRTWPDGSYWSSGLGCGMDNQPRLPRNEVPVWAADVEEHIGYSHAHMAWSDACFQALLSAKLLLSMADALKLESWGESGQGSEAKALQMERLPTALDDLRAETKSLQSYINGNLWDEESAFYYDKFSNGTLGRAKTIGAYWALLADATSLEWQKQRFIAHLSNPDEFARPHPIPTLSADDPMYHPVGDYWRGGVWAPTNYMTLRGLTRTGNDDLAYEIGRKHLDCVLEVFDNTDTVWENYAPESCIPGDPARRDFVGWSGLGPVAVLLEYVFGLRPDAHGKLLIWDARLLERHGVTQYPFGTVGSLDLECAARSSADDEPQVRITASTPVTVEVRWGAGQVKRIEAG